MVISDCMVYSTDSAPTEVAKVIPVSGCTSRPSLPFHVPGIPKTSYESVHEKHNSKSVTLTLKGPREFGVVLQNIGSANKEVLNFDAKL